MNWNKGPTRKCWCRETPGDRFLGERPSVDICGVADRHNSVTPGACRARRGRWARQLLDAGIVRQTVNRVFHIPSHCWLSRRPPGDESRVLTCLQDVWPNAGVRGHRTPLNKTNHRSTRPATAKSSSVMPFSPEQERRILNHEALLKPRLFQHVEWRPVGFRFGPRWMLAENAHYQRIGNVRRCPTVRSRRPITDNRPHSAGHLRGLTRR